VSVCVCVYVYIHEGETNENLKNKHKMILKYLRFSFDSPSCKYEGLQL